MSRRRRSAAWPAPRSISTPRGSLGQILFDVMKICEAPKKTRTGQYATDEQTLAALAPDHEIVQRLLEHRVAYEAQVHLCGCLAAGDLARHRPHPYHLQPGVDLHRPAQFAGP